MHLQKLGVELEALTFQWFLSIFTDCLAAEALFRIWDVILCLVGSPFLFQVALALLRLNEKALISCKSAAAVYSYLNGEMTHQGISIDGLIRESDGMKHHVKRKEVELRRESAVEKELGEVGEVGSEGNGNATEAVRTDLPIRAVANSSDEESQEPSTKSIHNEEKDRNDVGKTKGEATGVAEAEPSSSAIQEETTEELLAEDAEPFVETIEHVASEDQKTGTISPPPPDKPITSIPMEASAIPIVATT